MKLTFIFFLTIGFYFACQTSNSHSLEIYPAIKDHFTAEQIVGLDSIRQFFITATCPSANNSNTEECLTSFLEGLRQKALQGQAELGLASDRHADFIAGLAPMVREAIWEPGLMVQDRQIDSLKVTDTIQVLNLRIGGKYMLFLQSLAKENPKIKYYVETFNASGDISPILFGDVMQNFRDYNLKDPQVQLALAVHYLTIQDHALQMRHSKEKES